MRWWGKVKNHLSVIPKDCKYKLVFQFMTETPLYQNGCCAMVLLFTNKLNYKKNENTRIKNW